MLAEAEKMAKEAPKQNKHLLSFKPLERDWEQARLECLYAGSDIVGDLPALAVYEAYNKIEDGWIRFFETCDLESEEPDLEGLLMVLGTLSSYSICSAASTHQVPSTCLPQRPQQRNRELLIASPEVCQMTSSAQS